MKLGPIWQKMYHRGLLRLAIVSGVLAEFSGCENTDVTKAILGGLNEFVVALVDAFFLAIQPTSDGSTTVTTWLFDAVTTALC